MIYQRTDLDKMFQGYYRFPIYQSMKEARRNFYKRENIKEQLLEITRDFFSQFQQHEIILKTIIMSITFLILVRHIQL